MANILDDICDGEVTLLAVERSKLNESGRWFFGVLSDPREMTTRSPRAMRCNAADEFVESKL